jgi:hypothetical protein
MMDTKHIIYRTTNLLNNRYYIGMHSTTKVKDGYLGSGRRIKAEIKKYGKENFVREVLEELPSREALKLREAEIVNDELLSDELCMNLKNGGEGGWDHLIGVNSPLTKEARAKGGRITGKIYGPVNVKNLQTEEVAIKRKQTIADRYGSGTFSGRKHSEETKMKMREVKRLRDLQNKEQRVANSSGRVPPS